jgi:ferrochelatase
MARTAVVLFNLGGPDRPAAVEPFLFNLFNDRAIIDLPQPLRWLVAKVISRRRAPLARDIYARLGGGSPLLELTRAQGEALAAAVRGPGEAEAFIAMRYWEPRAEAAAAAVRAWGADRIVLLPLYPQFSTTTTQSSLDDWRRAADRAGLDVPTAALCCYPTAEGLVRAHAELIRGALREAARTGAPRLLFSAHGLPKKVVARGDPYEWQVHQTAAAIADALAIPDLDHVVCYQSRVGPLEWLGPSTEAEIARAGADGRALVVVPIAFVSEHSETLVELDIEYRKLAEGAGVPAYVRVPALGTHPAFIDALAALVADARPGPRPVSHLGRRLCPPGFRRCPCREGKG